MDIVQPTWHTSREMLIRHRRLQISNIILIMAEIDFDLFIFPPEGSRIDLDHELYHSGSIQDDTIRKRKLCSSSRLSQTLPNPTAKYPLFGLLSKLRVGRMKRMSRGGEQTGLLLLGLPV
jgi:hypothetical protein